MSAKRKLLVIDDEPANCRLIRDLLARDFDVTAAGDGASGVQAAKDLQPDVILLDVIMPEMDGLSVCQTLRQAPTTRHIPVIMLTGKDDPDSRTSAFTAGADDYITKPFGTKELIARIGSKIRRIEENSGPVQDPNSIVCGNLSLNSDRFETLIDGRSVALSVLEFNLLKFFAQHKESVLSRETILQNVWQDSVVTDRTVDTHVAILRKKLTGSEYAIKTLYGAGYVFKRA